MNLHFRRMKHLFLAATLLAGSAAGITLSGAAPAAHAQCYQLPCKPPSPAMPVIYEQGYAGEPAYVYGRNFPAHATVTIAIYHLVNGSALYFAGGATTTDATGRFTYEPTLPLYSGCTDFPYWLSPFEIVARSGWKSASTTAAFYVCIS